jgi:hypothetical protein
MSNHITGRVQACEQTIDEGLRQYSFEWVGGNTIGVTRDLLEQADPALLRREGDVLVIGPYRARIVEENVDVLVAQRIEG